MDFTTKTILFTITLTSLLFLGSADGPPPSNIHVVQRGILRNGLLDFCKKTSNPKLCEETIQPHFLKDRLDPYQALSVEVEATFNQTQKAMSIVDELDKKPGISKSLKDSLKICKDQYGNIFDAIKLAKDAIAQRNVVEARAQLSAVISSQQSCKDSFQGFENEFSFSKDDDGIFQLGGNCLDISADIQKSEPQVIPPITPSPPNPFSNVIGTIG